MRHHPNFPVLLAHLEAKKGSVLDSDVEQAAHRFLNPSAKSVPMGIERTNQDRRSAGTLGDVLYADKVKALVREEDWLALLRAIAAGDQPALHALYERTHRMVHTLAVRITNNREAAEEVTLDVFHDVWQRASTYDPADGSVVGWIMNQARSRALDRLQMRPEPVLPKPQPWAEPHWEEVAAGIFCKLLATDMEHHRVSMLVRLAPGGEYPPHRHAGVEELHLLEGELWIDDRKLYAGDYNRAEPGTADSRVWSETGCTCVLITSTLDELH
jgi:DNA-directed RNA polymerase specialized sigma24 family protein